MDPINMDVRPEGYDYGRTPDLSKSGPLIQSLVLISEQSDIYSKVDSNNVSSGPNKTGGHIRAVIIY